MLSAGRLAPARTGSSKHLANFKNHYSRKDAKTQRRKGKTRWLWLSWFTNWQIAVFTGLSNLHAQIFLNKGFLGVFASWREIINKGKEMLSIGRLTPAWKGSSKHLANPENHDSRKARKARQEILCASDGWRNGNSAILPPLNHRVPETCCGKLRIPVLNYVAADRATGLC